MSTDRKMGRKRYAALSAAAWLFWSSSALCAAGGDSGSSSEHVTTKAVNVEANYEQELLKEEPETKTIITREDLDRKGARNLSDALAAEQSIQMGTDNMGRKTISIRGAEARHTLILVDGKRLAGGLSKYYGATDEANRLGVDNIDHIEVIRGSGTARFGADAIGGVINIVTKMPHKRSAALTMEGSWIGEGGSQYNHNASFATGEVGKGIYMDFSVGQSKTAPFLYDSDGTSMQYYGKRNPLSGRVEFTLGKGETLTLAADRQTEDLQKDTTLGKFTAGKGIAMVASEDAWRNNFSIDWKKQTSLADYRVRFYQTEHDSDVNYHVFGKGVPYRHFYFDNFNRKDNVLEASVGLMPHDKHYVTVGADYHDEYGEGTRIEVPKQTPREETRFYTFPNPSDPSHPNKRSYTGNIFEASLNYYSAYVMDSWQVGKNLLVIPSLRYTNHSHFGVNLSPSIGATYKVSRDLRVKANIGTSFATGGIAELYHNWEMYEPSLNASPPIRNGWLFEGNPGLKPEKALNMDISVEKDFDKKTHAKLTLFRNDFEDYMQIAYIGEKGSKNLDGRTYYDTHIRYPDPWGISGYDDLVNALNAASNWTDIENNVIDESVFASGVPATDDVYTYKNISKARTQGIELEATREFTPEFSVKFGYTFLDAKDRNTNKRLEGRARHMLNLTLNYDDRKNGWRATFWGDYAWNYLDIRDRVLTGRIVGADGGQELEHVDFTDPNTGEVYHLVKSDADARMFMRGDIEHGYTREKVAREKNYGVWNLMVEKDVTKTATVYAGVTNVFDAYDPYLGLGGRIYRLGMRMTF
ncbi:TonB-dependent receptor [uncultured Selenomonas sp.]|uniref:TonB-dependent receptor plug domain-containing protein n=1 Tax=uncultured Selenomonas sp. TaxID=159275 RepID=UPI0028DB1967|nr:TonB-dependent receptor [uncultured Selenomonas sp.]